jgi:hypothetical protein
MKRFNMVNSEQFVQFYFSSEIFYCTSKTKPIRVHKGAIPNIQFDVTFWEWHSKTCLIMREAIALSRLDTIIPWRYLIWSTVNNSSIFFLEKIYYTSKPTHIGFAKKLSSALNLMSLFLELHSKTCLMMRETVELPKFDTIVPWKL